MAEHQPSKKEIELIFKRLRSIPSNKVCFDCTSKIPTWSSVTYGVFICIDCSAVHRSLGVHLTFVRSTQLDINWTWLQLRQMQLGGNANAESFFQQHNCTTKDAQQKYNSRAAQLYKEKLVNAATHAMRLHGTKLYLDSDQDQSCTDYNKEVDFFEEQNNFENSSEVTCDKEIDQDLVQKLNTNMNTNMNLCDTDRGPTVNLTYATDSSNRKPTIGLRKPQAKRSGIGGKKNCGLGAQRVKTNFAEIEREAELADKLKVQEKKAEKETKGEEEEEEEAQIMSMRLVYEDLSMKKKHEEEKMKAVDPLKAQQMERLGMGLGARSGISHSALNDMRTIEQESPNKRSKAHLERRNSSDFFEDFGFSSSTSSGYSMYKSSSEYQNISSLSSDSLESCRTTKPLPLWSEKPTVVEKKHTPSPSVSTNEAQKKFGSAKAISSDQFFSDSPDMAWERKTNLSRFEGSSSISSAEYFGKPETTYNRGGLAPDLEDVKESVRQGVTKVAGKLSSLANGVMSSIQRK